MATMEVAIMVITAQVVVVTNSNKRVTKQAWIVWAITRTTLAEITHSTVTISTTGNLHQ